MTSPLSAAPFPGRLAAARRLLARGAPVPAVHVADQLGAASREVRQMHDRLGLLLPLLEPERVWNQRFDTSPSTGTKAYLLAAVLGCPTTCCHLRKGGPQPALVNLALRRIDCQRCAGTIRRPPPEDDDQCDICGARSITTFTPFAARHGPALVVGDACRACARILSILQEATA